jgi:hypothetical protein
MGHVTRIGKVSYTYVESFSERAEAGSHFGRPMLISG